MTGKRAPAALTMMTIGNELDSASREELRSYLAGASRDGTINRAHGTLRIAQADIAWLHVLQDVLKRLGHRSWIYRERSTVHVIETCFRVDRSPALTDDPARSAFARGYFDAEGGLPRQLGARAYIQFVQKDLADLNLVRCAVVNLGVVCGRIHNPSWRVDPGIGASMLRVAVTRCLRRSFGVGIRGSA
jgi:hypothetical protein